MNQFEIYLHLIFYLYAFFIYALKAIPFTPFQMLKIITKNHLKKSFLSEKYFLTIKNYLL